MTAKLISTKELAELMGWSIHTVYQRRYRGDTLPRAIDVGGHIRYRIEDVEEWLEAHADPIREPA